MARPARTRPQREDPRGDRSRARGTRPVAKTSPRGIQAHPADATLAADAPRETISFKADEHLAARLRSMANRSDFIRLAVLKALGQVCPTCRGTGVIGAERRSDGCP